MDFGKEIRFDFNHLLELSLRAALANNLREDGISFKRCLVSDCTFLRSEFFKLGESVLVGGTGSESSFNAIDLGADLSLQSSELVFIVSAVSACVSWLAGTLSSRSVTLAGLAAATDIGRDVCILAHLNISKIRVFALSLYSEIEVRSDLEGLDT